MKNILFLCMFLSVVHVFSQSATFDQKKNIDVLRTDPFNEDLYKKVDLLSVVKNTTLEISSGKNDPKLFIIRSVAKKNLGDVYGAINDLDKVVKLTEAKTDELLTRSLIQRGIFLYAIGEKQKGCLDWSRAGELSTDSEVYRMIRVFCKVELELKTSEEKEIINNN